MITENFINTMLNRNTEQKAEEAKRKVENAHIVRHKLKFKVTDSSMGITYTVPQNVMPSWFTEESVNLSTLCN